MRELVAVRDREADFSAVFGDRFENRATWRAGWGLALTMGASAAPALRGMWEREDADGRARLVLLTALVLAAGEPADALLLERLRRDSGRREHVLCLMLIALGPERAGGARTLSSYARRTRLEPVQQVAACLALRRFPAAAAPPDRFYDSTDVGIAAAVRFARPRADDRRLDAWFQAAARPAELVQRAVLLGSRGDAPWSSIREVWTRPGGGADSAVRLAAALCVAADKGAAERLDELGDRIDWEQTAALAARPDLRAELFRRRLLKPPPDRIDPAMRARIAVAFALVTDLQRWGETATRWREDSQLAPALCLGLAWRLYGESGADPRWATWLPDVPEAEWVRLALGLATPSARPRSFTDDLLDRAYLRAREGRLPAAAARDVLERALWRSRAHLGLTRFEAECELVRDLLISGSIHGRSALALSARDEPYLPKGIAAGDNFFALAYETYDYIRDRAPWRPRALRLR